MGGKKMNATILIIKTNIDSCLLNTGNCMSASALKPFLLQTIGGERLLRHDVCQWSDSWFMCSLLPTKAVTVALHQLRGTFGALCWGRVFHVHEKRPHACTPRVVFTVSFIRKLQVHELWRVHWRFQKWWSRFGPYGTKSKSRQVVNLERNHHLCHFIFCSSVWHFKTK